MKHLKHFRLIAGGLLWLSAATATQAASFTVNYTGSVTEIRNFEVDRFGPINPDDEDFQERSAPRPPEETTAIEGNYRFDDENNQVLSAQFSVITPTGTTTRSFLPEAVPITSSEQYLNLFEEQGFVRTTASNATLTSASYGENYEDLSSFSSNGVSVDRDRFVYYEDNSSIGSDPSTYEIVGIIDQLAVVDTTKPDNQGPENPTSPQPNSPPASPVIPQPGGPSSRPNPVSVPEPTTALGLLLLAGLGTACKASIRR